MKYYGPDGSIKSVEDDRDPSHRVYSYPEPRGTGEPSRRRKANRHYPKSTGPTHLSALKRGPHVPSAA
jgi:hypothetical protein